ncbi:MAG: 6-carboxyhexanoate--CoA ligase [Nitrospirota bacterium]|nr:6-carboxyhexanoate--CoA ligase [Nitrospirota bacterium]MDH5767554.1 6-carboxyhexanoate--CoA ligase [Nitrospirota bacterium]
MKNLLSIRMRASQKVKTRNVRSTEIHISGAEGLYKKSEIHKIVKNYIERALHHPKGMPDTVVVTIEDIRQNPLTISALPVATINNNSPTEAENSIIRTLQSLGISKKAIQKAFALIKKGGMRGAALITAKNGNRLEPDRERGIRVSRLGMNKPALKVLSAKLSRHGINTDTVKEAIILASKVTSCKDVIAELCVSDDPDYTTGYVASKIFGYVRIPDIKPKGSKNGGRAFFVREGADTEYIIDYLERRPVIVGKVALCKGIMSLDEILNRSYQ